MAPRKAVKPLIKAPATKNTKDTMEILEVIVKKKTDFFDISDEAVKTCWEKIFTMVLAQKKPILVDNIAWSRYGYQNGTLETHPVPGAAHFEPRLSELGKRVYFSENTFHFSGGMDFANWTLMNREPASLLRRVGVDFVQHFNLTWMQESFKRCTDLQELSIGINELELIEDMLRPSMGFQRMKMRPRDVTPQLNLLVLRANHMDKLRQIRVPKVTFTPLIHGSRNRTNIASVKRTTGPIRGGVLEKVVAKEMMQPQEPVTSAKQITTTMKTDSAWKRKTVVESDDEYKPSYRGQASKRARIGTRTTPARAAKAAIAVQATADGPAVPSPYVDVEPVEPEPEPEPEQKPDTEAEVEREHEANTGTETDSLHFTFPILDLPAELRNKIYQCVLVHEGTINPSKRVPTTHHRAGATLGEDNLYRPGVPPYSCLALLQTNNQVYAEAKGIFYAQNSFVFYYPNQLMMFLHSIREERRLYIERVTLWYKNQRQGDIDSIDTNLAALMQLKNLKRFELILSDSVTDSLRSYSFHMPGEDMMTEMAKGNLEILVRNQDLDYHFWKRGRDNTYGSGVVSDMVSQRKAIRNLKKRIKPTSEGSDASSDPKSQSSD